MQRLPNQPPIPRRQGTLHLDLSRWEEPRRFWGDSPSSPTEPTSPIQSRGAHANAVAGPSQVRGKPPVKLPPPAPILPTTNVAAARARQQGPSQAQTSTSAPVVDVTALLAEMHGVAPKPAPVPTSTPAAAGPSRPPVSAPSRPPVSAPSRPPASTAPSHPNQTSDPRKRPPSSLPARPPPPAPVKIQALPSPPLAPAPAPASLSRTTDPRGSRPSSTAHATSPTSTKPQRSAPLAPVQNAYASGRKRSLGSARDEDGFEDLKRVKTEYSKEGMVVGRRSPQKACPGSRLNVNRSPVKQEPQTVIPKWENDVVGLTGSDEED